jgi:hypothetical protein
VQSNALYNGDKNLDILRGYLPDAAVDLMYVDPAHQLEPRLQPIRSVCL